MSHNDDAKARLLAQIARQPAPTRAQLTKRTAIAITLAGTIIAAAVVVLGGPQPGERIVGFVAAVAIALALLGVRALIAGLATSAWAQPTRWRLIVAAPILSMAAIALAYLRAPTQDHVGRQGDVTCAVLTIGFAAILGAALMVSRRASDPIRPGLTALLLITGACTIAAAVVFLACPAVDPRHFALAHFGVALVAGAGLTWAALRIVRT